MRNFRIRTANLLIGRLLRFNETVLFVVTCILCTEDTHLCVKDIRRHIFKNIFYQNAVNDISEILSFEKYDFRQNNGNGLAHLPAYIRVRIIHTI